MASQEEVDLLNRLVDDLRELALSDAGELKLMCQTEDISQLIQQSIKAIQVKADDKKIQISADLPPSLPLVNIDYHRISQVMCNLLTNAITHTPAGGQIVVSAIPDGKYVKVSVTDNGEGILPKNCRICLNVFTGWINHAPGGWWKGWGLPSQTSG